MRSVKFPFSWHYIEWLWRYAIIVENAFAIRTNLLFPFKWDLGSRKPFGRHAHTQRIGAFTCWSVLEMSFAKLRHAACTTYCYTWYVRARILLCCAGGCGYRGSLTRAIPLALWRWLMNVCLFCDVLNRTWTEEETAAAATLPYNKLLTKKLRNTFRRPNIKKKLLVFFVPRCSAYGRSFL